MAMIFHRLIGIEIEIGIAAVVDKKRADRSDPRNHSHCADCDLSCVAVAAAVVVDYDDGHQAPAPAFAVDVMDVMDGDVDNHHYSLADDPDPARGVCYC